MIDELDKTNYEKVRPLFLPLDLQPFCLAVLAGVHPGRVFVDDLAHPQAAFVAREDGWGFLGGNPKDDAFNRALNQAIFEREIAGEETFGLLLTCHPEDWGGQLPVVFSPRQPIAASRRHYVCHSLKYNWQANIPEGFTVQRMDQTLLDRPELKVPDQVRETLEKWQTIDNPQFQDFGFVAIHEGSAQVASWATVDAIVDGVGDAGLVTAEAYRRRGLATITTAAALAHGFAHGVSTVSWTCAETNVGSIRTAEKLGFERKDDYVMYYFIFDEGRHLGNLAYNHLENKRYREAAELLEQVLTRDDDVPLWVYHDAAQAWAELGDGNKALEYLNLAVDKGWSAIDAIKTCQEFECLHGTKEWEAVLERIQSVGRSRPLNQKDTPLGGALATKGCV